MRRQFSYRSLWKYLLVFWIGIFLFHIPVSSIAEKTPAFSVKENFKGKRLAGSAIWVLEDRNNNLSIDQVKSWYEKGERGEQYEYYSFGLKRSAFWMAFDIQNADAIDREVLLEMINSYLSNFQMHRFLEDGTVLSDTLLPHNDFHKRGDFVNHSGSEHRNFHFSFELPQGSRQTFILHFAPSEHAFNIRMHLWDAKYRFTEHRDFERFLLHTFFILAFVMLLILGFAIYITRFHYYWYYFIYVVLGTFFVFTDMGSSYQYIWPGAPGFQQIASPIIANLYLITGVLFIREYFNTKKYYRRTDRVLLIVVGIAAAIIPLIALTMKVESVTFSHWLFKCANMLYVTTCVIFFILLFRAIFKGQKYFSGLFLFGFSLHGLSVITSNLQYVQVLPGGSLATLLSGIGYPLTFNTHITLMLGMLLEMIIVFYIGIRRFTDIYQTRDQSLKDLAVQKEENRNLLVMGIESERERIARDLHDDLGRLTAVKMKLNLFLEEHASKNGAQEKIEDIIEDLDTSHSELRGIARNLMPKALYDYGLMAAVEELVHRIQILEKKMDIHLYSNMSFVKTSRFAQLYLFRIVQEMLNNLVKYSKATDASIQFIRHDKEGKLLITIEDDGIGFDISKAMKKGNGLKNIKYRVEVLNGEVNFDSSPGSGTLISAEIPLIALEEIRSQDLNEFSGS